MKEMHECEIWNETTTKICTCNTTTAAVKASKCKGLLHVVPRLATLNEPPVVDQSRVELLRRGRRDQSSVWSQKAPLTLRQLANVTPRAGSTTCRYNVSYYTIHNM